MDHNKKLLVVDDEPHIRRVIEIKFKSRGYQVYIAKNGEEGLKKIHAIKPDIVIMDVNMPRLDGKSVCEKTDHLKEETPFLTIIMTCHISSIDQEWIDQRVDTVFVEKPFSPSRLLDHVQEYEVRVGNGR